MTAPTLLSIVCLAALAACGEVSSTSAPVAAFTAPGANSFGANQPTSRGGNSATNPSSDPQSNRNPDAGNSFGSNGGRGPQHPSSPTAPSTPSAPSRPNPPSSPNEPGPAPASTSYSCFARGTSGLPVAADGATEALAQKAALSACESYALDCKIEACSLNR